MGQPSTPSTRRGFLRAGGLAAASLMWPDRILGQVASLVNRGDLARRYRKPLSVVVRAQSELVSNAAEIRLVVLREMFNESLKLLSGTASVRQAWLRFLQPDDIIGVNFDPCGAQVLGIDRPMALMVVNSLIQSGWPAEHLVLRGAPEAVVKAFGTRTPRFGWTEQPVAFGDARDELSSFTNQVSAIINVPLLKDDNLLGLSCSLKSATYDLLKHPARYHADGGLPHLADLYALSHIRGKIRLNIVNGLRTVYHGGPMVQSSWVDPTGLLLMGTDAVAVDAVALELLNAIRDRHQLPPRAAPLVGETARRGLGHADFRKIQRLSVTGI